MRIYLNNASTSYPKPNSVLEAVTEHLRTLPENYGRAGSSSIKRGIVGSTRELISDFFGAGSSYNFVFTSGSTEALNLAIFGTVQSKCHIVTSAIEHNSVLRPLKELERRYGCEITFVECDAHGNVSASDIERAIRPDTKIMAINHCSNVTGALTDINLISSLANKYGCILIVDGSQSSGIIPIDLEAINCHYFAFTGHKSLFGLQGSGGLFIRKDIHPLPLKFGGTGFKSSSIVQPQELPYKYESGTPNIPGIIALNAGINEIKIIGIENIYEHKYQYLRILTTELLKISNIKLYYQPNNNINSLISFNIGKLNPDEVNYWLETNYGISCRSGIMCSPLIRKYIGTEPYGCVRLSPSHFTTIEEIDYTINAIKTIANNEQKLL